MFVTSTAEAGRAGRWRRLLADRRVGTKIMIAVGIVTLFSMADGL